MVRFLFFLRFARRRRLQATLRLLRSAKRHLSLVSTPASQGRKDKAMVRLLRRLRAPLDAGGYDEGLLTVEQIESLHNETRAFLSAEPHFQEEAAHLRRNVAREMIPATVEALGRAVIP